MAALNQLSQSASDALMASLKDTLRPRDERIAELEAALKRLAELEKLVNDMHGSGLRFTFSHETFVQGIRVGPGDYVLIRGGPATADEKPF